MKVLLLNPPGSKLYLRDQHCSTVSKAYYYWPPIDLIMQSGILSEKHEIKVLDAIIDRISDNECLKTITDFSPDCVFFVTGIVSWIEDFDFMKRLKAQTGAKMIASGGFLLTDYKQVMEDYPFLDAVLMDYSVDVIDDYLDGNYAVLNDISYRDGDKIISTPSSHLKQFSIPVPRHELFHLDKYRLPHNKLNPFSSVMANYGCPFTCSFCVAENIDFKYRPVENVIAELEKLVSIGVKEIFFKDFTFGIPKNVAVELCEQMIVRFPKLSWICESRVNVLDEEMLILMKKAGCHTIQFGVESSNQSILDRCNKQASTEQTAHIFDLCNKLRIKTLAHFVLGLPGETVESVLETVKFAKMLKCDYASFNVAIPLPGTTLRKYCMENCLIKGNDETLDCSTGYPVIETDLLSREKLWELRNKALRSFYLRPSYIINKLFNLRSPNDLIFLIREAFSMLRTIKRPKI